MIPVVKILLFNCLFLAYWCQVPPREPYEVTRDFSHEPNWDNSPSFFETMVHRDEEFYEPKCVVNLNEQYARYNNCLGIKLKHDPEPPFLRCRILINEVNTDNPGDQNNNLFIELSEVCFDTPTRPASSLKGFKLIVIGGASEKIEIVVDLRDTKLPEFSASKKRYVVIGTDTVPKVTLKLSDKNVQSIYNNVGHTYKLPVGDQSPYGIILLYSPSIRDLNKIRLSLLPPTDFWEPQIITPEIMATIKKFSQDQVVYGRKCQTNRCDIFESLWFDPTILKPNMKYLLRDWDSAYESSAQDYSISRCNDLSHPFRPDYFKLAVPSPGEDNNCNSAARYILEDKIDKVTHLFWRPFPPPSSVPAQCLSDQINIPNERYQMVDETLYLRERDEALNLAKRICIRDDSPSSSYAQMEMEVDINNDILLEGNEVPLTPPYSINNFKPEWVEAAAPYLPAIAKDILLKPEIQKWLRITTTPTNPVRFSCEICSTMVSKHFKIERNHNKAIMTESGYFSSDKSRNKKEILDHNVDSVHFQSEAFLREIWARETRDLVMKMIEDKDSTASKLLLPSLMMVRSVFVEATEAIPFAKHKHLVNLQKMNGVNLGVHHYGQTAAEQMTATIADYFHETLLDHLVEQNKDFSIILDSTTDTRNIPYLTVHFQTLKDNRPVIYFYRVLPLLNGESALAMKNSLWEKIKDDTTEERNFEQYVKDKMTVYVSDGAASMTGSKSSLWVLLRVEIGRFIPNIVCMAHKLENSIKRGIKSSTDPDLLYFEKFNKSVNKFYVFYSSRGSKRWAHFEQTAEELGIRPNRIKYFFDIRWASSHFICLENLYKMYTTLIEDTKNISTDASFTKAANTEALVLNKKLLNKSWVLVLHEFLDMLGVYKQVSLDLQAKAGVLPGKYGIIQIAVTKLEMLKEHYGAYVFDLLQRVSCPSAPCLGDMCRLEEYEACDKVKYDDKYELTDNDGERISLFNKRSVLYDSIISGLHHYFNLEELQHFEVFNQQLYPVPVCGSNNPGFSFDFDTLKQQADLKFLGEFYGMSTALILEIQTNWELFMKELIFSTPFVQNRNEPFEAFWPLVLKSEPDEIPHLTTSIRSLILKMLVTPFSSAEAERAFSFLTREKSGIRSSMNPETLDRLMRLNLNGKRNLATFNALKPTLKWLQKNSRVDDPSFQETRDANPKNWNMLLNDDSLF